MKKDKELKRRYGKLAESMVAYYDRLDLRLLDDLDDDAFAYIMTNVRGVNMLDLNEVNITNESIRLISKLEYVKELRIKGCHYIDDECVAGLNKITSLEFLHLKNTAVTIDGLLKLNALTNLRTVLFSADDVDLIREKMLQLKKMHPACEFIIDGKAYYFNALDRFMYAIKGQPYSYRMKIKNQPTNGSWSNWLGHPSDNYIEAEAQGTYSLDDIEWIDINPVEVRNEGKLVAAKKIDHSPEIIKLMEALSFPYMKNENIISAYIVKKELQ
ncbi:MAG TPA: DUF6678 family protein [Ferruginibacter sp.]|nr:DUF6678 family protein [Ferruginibacter sp.]